jgi:peptidoglycan/xylan/chitin deacetylase (PgdA/CDA1 family)
MACAEAGSTEAMETHVLQSADDGEALAPPPCATLVLCYHRVRPQVADDPYGLTITCDRFEEQLDALASWGRFMAPAELFEPSAPVSDRPRILVTFDDGYRDNLEHAFPILSRRGIPAAWFVVTGAVERSAPFWWETVALAHRRGHDVPLGDPEGWRFLPAALRARRLSGVEARLSHADIEQIASMCPTWPTLVADARRFGIVLGAHTSTHTSLGRLATADIERGRGLLDALTRRRAGPRPCSPTPRQSRRCVDRGHRRAAAGGSCLPSPQNPGP